MNGAFTHEFILAIYGAGLWHVIKFLMFVGKAQKAGLGWKAYRKYIFEEWDDLFLSIAVCAIAIVFDDEVMGQYNKWAESDIIELQDKHYFAMGVFIDLIRNIAFKHYKINIDQYKDL